MKGIKSSLLLGFAVLPMIGTSVYSKEYKSGWHKPNSFDMSTDQLRMYDNLTFKVKSTVVVKQVSKKIPVQVKVVHKEVPVKIVPVKIVSVKLIELTSMDEYYAAHSADRLAHVRLQLLDQWKDPDVRAAVQARVEIEVGSQGQEAQQAFLETVANRAIARYDGDLIKTVNNHDGYYPKKDNTRWKNIITGSIKSELEDKYKHVSSKVFVEASNITRYGTGNASGSVGFGGGPQTLKSGGEKFGIEATDLGWHKSIVQAKN